MVYLPLAGAVFLGWALGANDTSNVFGTAVATRMLKFRYAALLAAGFIIAGALLQGGAGIDTLAGISGSGVQTAFISSLAAAITVTIMTIMRLPISTSQAVVGAIIGIGIMNGAVNTSGLKKIVICWIATPIGGIIFAIIVYNIIMFVLRFVRPTIFNVDSFIKAGLVVAGCYGAYALGANNVANVAGVFAGGIITPFQALLIGSFSIALGVLTYSRRVMATVGTSIVKLDSLSALVVVVAHSITVHIFAVIGVPVSSSQAVIGAVIGIGFIKGVQTVNLYSLLRVFTGWIFTPALACAVSVLIFLITRIRVIL